MARTYSRGPSKAFYLSAINFILPVNLLCGLFAWFTQFLLPCSATRLHVLMTLASQIFLANVLAMLLVYLLLFALRDTEPVGGWRNRLVQWQLATTSISMSFGFMFLAVCITTGYVDGGDSRVGVFGAALFGILVFGTIFVGFSTTGAIPAADNSSIEDDVPQLNWLQFVPVIAVIVLEVVMFVVLLAVGGTAAAMTPIYTQCTLPGTVLIASDMQPLPVIVENGSMFMSSAAPIRTVTQTIIASPSLLSRPISGSVSTTVTSAQTLGITAVDSTATVLTIVSTTLTL